MEWQRNIQLVKEQNKNLPNQTKEKTGNLLEKQFRIMIVKMTQNIENKMELQINGLETRIEKMQEMFYKDLEEIKKSQLIMNNTITQMKSILEGTNNRKTEEEERIRVEEDRMVDIIKQSRKKKKRLK